jgi:hypothetical protein
MNIRTIIMLSAIGVGFARCLAGCLTDEMHKDVAGGLFAAQQNACVDKYADRASIDACRARVRAAWAVDAGTRTLAFGNDNGHPDASADAQEAGK